MISIDFTPEDIDALHHERFHHPHPRVQEKMEAVYLKSQGLLHKEICRLPQISENTLRSYLRQFQEGGIERLKRLVDRGQVEIMGGGFYEPILPSIPARDRVGQIRTYTSYLENLFGTRVRGMWIPERVWEQPLVADDAA